MRSRRNGHPVLREVHQCPRCRGVLTAAHLAHHLYAELAGWVHAVRVLIDHRPVRGTAARCLQPVPVPLLADRQISDMTMSWKEESISHAVFDNRLVRGAGARGLQPISVPLLAHRQISDMTVSWREKSVVGFRAFSDFGPSTWNDLPFPLRQKRSLDSFIYNLKPFHFSKL